MKVTTEMATVAVRGGSGTTVVVGMKMDAQSRELLTWALVKVAQPGDSVVALHVLPELCPSFGHGSTPGSTSLLCDLDSVLAMYEGFFTLKQIDLKLRLCRGSSVRKALVRETRSLSASALVLGECKKNHGFRFDTTAKYCARNVVDHCLVLAVNNGKIVFQREPRRRGAINGRNPRVTSSKNPMLVKGGNDDSFCLPPTRNSGNGGLRSIKHTNNKNSMLLGGSDDEFLCLLPRKGYERRGRYGGEKKSRSIASVIRNRTRRKEENSSAIIPARCSENTRAPMSRLIESIPEAILGWPLLRKAVLYKNKISYEKYQMSVFCLTTMLPKNYPASFTATVCPNQKPNKMQTTATESLDGKTKATVPLGVDATPPDASTVEESTKLPKELEDLHNKYSSTCRLFTFKELASATSNFSPDNFIGKGGSSRVYRGILPDGREIAVKILKRTEDVLKEFAIEIEIVTTFLHKNIISLNGFCFDDDKLHLVYDFMSRGTLEENLQGENKSKASIGWSERHKVAVGVAEALVHLHGGQGDRPVIHRDVKTSNILLSDDFEARLSDFGLATWTSATSPQLICGEVAGTFGYLAPEYFMFGKATEKIDVYAFGVVLLELLSGKKPIGNDHQKGQGSLIMWTKPILRSGTFTKLLDPSLGSKYDDDQMERMVLAASLCVKRSPRLRPNMATVLKLLKGDDVEVTDWAKSRAYASEVTYGPEDETTACSPADLQSHLNLALLGVEDDTLSVASIDRTADYMMAHGSSEAYLHGRWSGSFMFK